MKRDHEELYIGAVMVGIFQVPTSVTMAIWESHAYPEMVWLQLTAFPCFLLTLLLLKFVTWVWDSE